MNILDAYDQINRWIAESSGAPIDIGVEERCSFSRSRLFNENDLRDFESSSGVALPHQYRTFLKSVGAAKLFAVGGSGIEVLSPSEIKGFSKKVFYNFGDDLYPNLLLAVSMPRFGYFGGFLVGEAEIKDYSVFYPDEPPELWIEEADFVQFDRWIVNLVKSKGEEL